MLRKSLLVLAVFCLAAASAMGGGEGKPAAVHPTKARPYLVDKGNPNIMDQKVVKVLRTTNKAQVNRYVPRVYVFKHANPALALRFVRRFVQVEEGHIDTFVAPDGKSGRVLAVIPEYQVPDVDRVMKQLDRPDLSSTSGSQFEFVQLAHRSIMADGDGNGIPDMADAIYRCISNDTELYPDPETNGAIVYGPPSGVKCALDFAQKYDVPTPEVSVSAKVYEIETTKDGTLGLDYLSWKNGPGRALFSLGAFGEFEKIDYGRGGDNGMQFDSGAGTFGLPNRRINNRGLNEAYYIDVPSAFFDYLSVKGAGKVLTDARVSAMSGIPAVFRSVERIPFLKVTQPVQTQATTPPSAAILPVPPGQPLMNTGTVNDRRVESAVTNRVTEGVTISDLPRLASYEFEESGVVLWVTPTISLENIDLSILTSVADLVSFDDTGKPLLNTRVVATAVRAKSGEEIVLGGINRDHSIKTTRKIPFLGSIPVLGYLFGGEITSKQVTTVVEVVTPTLIENCSGTTEADANAIAQVETGAPVPLPRDEYGFDQYLLDPMKAK